MNSHFSKNKTSIIQKRPSSTSYVTAWQIESTLNNMLQFIDVIELSSNQRTHLQSLLPHVLRVKNIDDQRELLNQKIKELAKANHTYHKGSKEGLQAANQNKEKIVGFNHENKLKKYVKNLREQVGLIEKQISSINETTKQAHKNLQKIRNDKKQTLIAQVNSALSNQINSVTDKITQKQLSFNIGTEGSLYESFIEEQITKSLLPQRKSSQFMKSFSEDNSSFRQLITSQSQGIEHNQNQNPINHDNHRDSIKSIQIQFGEIKCKLLSLRDKKRKITVQNLLQNKRKNIQKSQGCNFDTERNKSIASTKSPVKTQQKLQQDVNQTLKSQKTNQREGNFFTSLFSIFSASSQPKHQSSSNLHIEQRKIPYSTIKNFNSPQQQNLQQNFEQSLEEMEDNQAKLRTIEINSQILQLRTQIDIMVNQNIFQQIIACIIKIKQINQQLHPLLDQLVQVVTIMGDQSVIRHQDFSLQLTPFQSPKIFESRKLSLSKFSTQSGRLRLKENQNMNFFINIIEQKFNQRFQVTKMMFSSFQQSIKVVIKYLRKRLSDIQEEYKQFIENDMKNDKKIKATQALKSRTQVLLISSSIENLSLEITDLIESRLLRVNQGLHKGSENFRKYLLAKISQLNEDEKSQYVNIYEEDFWKKCGSKERQVLENITLVQKQWKGQFQFEKEERGDFNLLKETINKEFFEFYENLASTILGLFQKK